ncbi:hypothetical protein BH11MYX1_BH11MYX1_05810 [soil metagenome]
MSISKAMASGQQSRAIVLYGDDGVIIHTHVIYALNGATITSLEDAEKRAFEIAKDLGRSVDHAKALHVEATDLLSGRFVVDVQAGTLKRVPIMTKP